MLAPEIVNDSWVLVLSLAGTLEEVFLSCADDKIGAGRLLGPWPMVIVELSLEILVLSLSGIEVVRPPVPNVTETVIVLSLLANVDVAVLSLSGVETEVLLVLDKLDRPKVLSLVGIVVVLVLSLSVVEAAVPFVPELLEMVAVLSLSESAGVDVLSLSGNEVVTLSLLDTMGVTETDETTVIDDIEDGTGTTGMVELT